MKHKVVSTLLSTLLLAGGPSMAVADDIAYLGVADGYWEVWLTDADKRPSTQLTRFGSDVSRISWYPDGRHLLVNRHDGQLYRLDTQSGDTETIAAPMPNILDAVLSPKGDSFAFSLSTSGSIDDNDIYVFYFHSRKLHKLTSMPRLQHEPTWSADGQSLYFLSGDGGQAHDIWKVDLASRSTEQLTVNALYHFDLAVRKDGALAYSGNQSGNYELWLRQADGETRQLTQNPALDARPAWSPAGDQLAFQSTRDGNINLWLLDIAANSLSPLTNSEEGARQPVWAPVQESGQ
ncbi:TolB family protein [Microbulbifer sp. 2201CG32-9]|uniref:TolB family protein n=1 Tax=Microbulbifer sp. 2201CG32-9 TaxID=3232309 RepID=UPI00345BAE14